VKIRERGRELPTEPKKELTVKKLSRKYKKNSFGLRHKQIIKNKRTK
jgi:hypothetical protein